eukprot:jgi/Bigna1/85279/estExt_fgenesh1_pg.C_30133
MLSSQALRAICTLMFLSPSLAVSRTALARRFVSRFRAQSSSRHIGEVDSIRCLTRTKSKRLNSCRTFHPGLVAAHRCRCLATSTSVSINGDDAKQRTTSTSHSSTSLSHEVPHVVIVGGGWAGFGAAEALSGFVEKGALKVTLLEASARGPGGLAAGWKTPKGRPVEVPVVGLHGFWRNYRNIDRLVTEVLGLSGDKSPFTPYTESSLFTSNKNHDGNRKGGDSSPPPSSLSVVAPVLGSLPRLPAPLGSAVWPSFGSELGLLDRATAVSLLGPWLDFDGSDSAWSLYDEESAAGLLKPPFSFPFPLIPPLSPSINNGNIKHGDNLGLGRFVAGAGVSDALYDRFLEPMLLVLPMAPGAEISAAAALSCFSFFALEHQGDFDVRWLRGSATSTIFAPWRRRLEARGVTIRDGARAEEFEFSDRGKAQTGNEAWEEGSYTNTAGRRVTAVKAAITSSQEPEELRIPCDAVINAVSISAVQKMVRNPRNEALAALPEFQRLLRLRAVGVVAVRLWLDEDIGKYAPKHTASNVCGGGMIEELEDIGFTFYWVNELQPEGGGGEGEKTTSTGGTVLEVDFYNADPILGLSDKAMVDMTVRALEAASPACFGSGRVSGHIDDFAVVRAPAAVSHFAPGTFKNLPKIRATSIDNWSNAGDFVDRGGHRSWSQEKALVTGYQAALATVEALASEEELKRKDQAGKTHGRIRRLLDTKSVMPPVLDVEPDEPHVAAGREVLRNTRSLLNGMISTLPQR